uniref:tRNA threonylcarbamoyladenosine biosynthesis protein TsaB n=1 Tax=Candidatus Kentrum sp. UNK TaxID=2126344 RepID=A0A451ASW9_9GAMM|nr:MAG: tRNA threonylcarbamoyl adenosine modification protein YeaZ [Candidatus Kentron sp. UNK]VFK69077.1 MAG: tRNA threonylcarbamoyl adenosine modification protein YeaZ [Candidatus Kentron sp. UNK]
MLVLGIDLSSDIGNVSLVQGQTVLGSVSVRMRHRPLLNCIQLIHDLFRLTDCKIDDLDLLSGVVGPGSWTGLRVTAVTLNTLSFTLQVPVVPVNLFDALAEDTICRDMDVFAVVQATRTHAHVAQISKNGMRIATYADIEYTTFAEITNIVGESADIIVSASDDAIDKLRVFCGDKIRLTTVEHLPPASIGAACVASGLYLAHPAKWSESFIRPEYLGSPVKGRAFEIKRGIGGKALENEK